jgi:hypothetical protein
MAYDPQQKGGELKVNGIAGALDTKDAVSVRVFVDGSVVEVFANERVAITARVYGAPGGPFQVEVSDPDGLELLEAWGMKPISDDRLAGSGDSAGNLSRGGKGAKRAKSK